MRISGEGGRLSVGYHVAAWLGSWTLACTRERPTPVYELAAHVSDLDRYWSQQAPMQLELAMAQRLWIWQAISPQIDADAQSLTVSLAGPPAIH